MTKRDLDPLRLLHGAAVCKTVRFRQKNFYLYIQWYYKPMHHSTTIDDPYTHI